MCTLRIYTDNCSLSIKKGSWWTVLQARHLIALCWKNASFLFLGLWLKHLIASLVLEKTEFYDIWEVFLDLKLKVVKVGDIKEALDVYTFNDYEVCMIWTARCLCMYIVIYLCIYSFYFILLALLFSYTYCQGFVVGGVIKICCV